MKRSLKAISLLFALVVTVACETQKVPAEAAMKAAESAWTAVSAEAVKVVPDQAKGVEEAIKTAKDALAKGDYAAVIKEAGALPARIADVQKAVVAKKAEWTSAWAALDTSLPAMVTAIQTQVDSLVKSKKLPAGVDKAAVDGAQTALAAVQQTWTDARAAYEKGDFAAALAKAGTVKDEAAKIMASIKMDMPTAADAMKAVEGAMKQ